MIEPDYLAFLREKCDTRDILFLVQLEQLVPGWWPNVGELAELLNVRPDTAAQALRRLKKQGLIKVTAYGKGGSFIWWIKRSSKDKPDPRLAPSWKVKDITTGKVEDVFIHQRRMWAERNNLHYPSFRMFLYGYRKVMAGKYKLVSTPIDKYS